MKKLDFLSDSPKAFIFQKSSNKTTFGGFLTIIYILIILIIAFVYIYNYVANDKYIISYINYNKPITETIIDKFGLDKNPNCNPTLNFTFYLNANNTSLSKNFILVDMISGNLLERGKKYQYNISSLNVGVFYNCSDKDCSLQPEDKEIYEKGIMFYFYIVKNTFSFNFQNKEEPITSNKFYNMDRYVLYPDFMQLVTDEWQIIQVKEEKGLLDYYFGTKKDSFGGTYFKSDNIYRPYQIINTTEYKFFKFSGVYKKIFGYFSNNSFSNFAEYSRKKVSVFSLIANICSLALTIFNGFRFGFNFFYSEKFSNYKVIDNILTSKRKPKQKKIIENKFDKSFPLLSINEMKDVEIEEKEEEEETEKINQTIEKEEDVDSLPKYHIFSFIGNFFYCKCCKKNKIQANITMCNNIIEKYYSIENLIYSQFMLENLLQDYKWNNPDLNSIKNIELIYKLKQMIKTDGIIQ